MGENVITGYDDPIKLFAEEKHRLYWANLNAKAFVVVNQGGTSSGKSECIIRVLFTIAILCAKYRILITTNTVPKLKQDALAIALVVAQLPEMKMFIKQYNATDRFFIFHNGSKMEFNSYATAEEAKGPKYHIVYITELTRVKWGVFEQLYMRTKVRMYVDYNPTDTFYIHTKVIGNPKRFTSVMKLRSDHRDNPYLSDEMHARIENIDEPGTETHNVYARGFTGRLRGTVYVNWVSVNTTFDYRDGVIWYVDWAKGESKTADPVAAGRIMIKPPDFPELDYLVDELVYDQAVSASEVAQVFKEVGYKDGQRCFCDHQPIFNYELVVNGITGAVPAVKGPGSVNSGILFTRKKKVGYTARSTNIHNEQSKYKFLEVDGIVTNTPVDEYNHHMDGIRYGVHGEAIYTGDLK